jgi:hypothetical protein
MHAIAVLVTQAVERTSSDILLCLKILQMRYQDHGGMHMAAIGETYIRG